MLTLRQSRRFLVQAHIRKHVSTLTFARPFELSIHVTFRSPRMGPVRTIRFPSILRRSKNARTFLAFWAIHARVTRWNVRYVFIFRRSRTPILVRAPVYRTPFSVDTRPPFEQSRHTVLSARMPAPFVSAFRRLRTFALSSDSHVLTEPRMVALQLPTSRMVALQLPSTCCLQRRMEALQLPNPELFPAGGHARLRSRQSLRAHCCRNVRVLTHLTMCKLAFDYARSSSTYCHQDSLAFPSPDPPPCSSF